MTARGASRGHPKSGKPAKQKSAEITSRGDQLSVSCDRECVHADALSRHVQAVTIDHTLSREVVKAEQGEDKFCKQLTVGKVRVLL
jgi:hypothetical protein